MRAQTDTRSFLLIHFVLGLFFNLWITLVLTDEDLRQKQGWLFGLERLGQVNFKNIF